MTQSADRPFVLWDSEARPPEGEGVYLWDGYREADGHRTIFHYCEENGDRLREKYARWIRDLGEFTVGGARVIDHLGFEDGFSYWWMTRFVEQSPWKSPAINEAIRLLALEEILAERRPTRVRLVSASRVLAETLESLCRESGIAYSWDRIHDPSRRRRGVRKLYRSLPQSVQALVSFARDLLVRLPLINSTKPEWFGGEGALLLCSYFMYMDQEALEKGRFRSRYWEDLPALMEKLGFSLNWLQLYRPDSAVPDAAAVRGRLDQFNRRRQEDGFHVLLESCLTWRVAFRVFMRWLRLVAASWSLRGVESAFRPRGSGLTLWPLMRGDWYASMRGPDSFSNLLAFELFDAALGELPRQSSGLYLCENHAWERAFVHAWRKHGHGRLIGVPHSTQSYWDLRYCRAPREFEASGSYPLPQPDLFAVNGRAAMDVLLSGNHPRGAVVGCEAARYMYLTDVRAAVVARIASAGGARVLVLGEYLPVGTAKMLKLLEKAATGLPASTTYTVKPHPRCPVEPADYPSLNLKAVSGPLGDILQDFDVVYSSNMTSAAVEPYVIGLPVVVALDGSKLNFSPLRGRRGVRFVDSAEALASAILNADRTAQHEPERDEFFYLDREMPRWREILLPR
jgi:surface carbohydrate biosynthesis protein (TIGR04326 family)